MQNSDGDHEFSLLQATVLGPSSPSSHGPFSLEREPTKSGLTRCVGFSLPLQQNTNPPRRLQTLQIALYPHCVHSPPPPTSGLTDTPGSFLVLAWRAPPLHPLQGWFSFPLSLSLNVTALEALPLQPLAICPLGFFPSDPRLLPL